MKFKYNNENATSTPSFGALSKGDYFVLSSYTEVELKTLSYLYIKVNNDEAALIIADYSTSTLGDLAQFSVYTTVTKIIIEEVTFSKG